MNFYKSDDIEAEITQMLDSEGNNYAVVVVKQCFSIPLIDKQAPKALQKNWSLFYEDICVDEPGTSPTLFENDFVLRKQKCDIVINAKAYTTSENSKDKSFIVGFRVGSCVKRAEVINKQRLQTLDAYQPVWLHYGSTWGGIWQKDEKEAVVFSANPIGKGYVPKKYQNITDSEVFPAVLYPHTRKNSIDPENIKPCAFSPLSRNATPRLGYAGTYDDYWYNEIFPLLPKDFDERFFQCVPEDQQIPFPKGGEIVEFMCLHPQHSHISFELPSLEIPVVLKDKQANLHQLASVIDTLQFDLEKQEFAIVWRCHHPLKRSLREIEVAIVGDIDKETYNQLLNCGSTECGDSSDEPCCSGCAEGENCEGDSDESHLHSYDQEKR